MPVEIEALTPTKLSLTIEVELDKVKAEHEKVFHEMAREVQIRGFRKGKAPRKMIEKYVNLDLLKKEVLQRIIPTAYDQALKSNNITPVTKPEYEVVSYTDDAPLKFKAVMQKRPDIPLKDYRGLEVEITKQELKEEDVEKTLQSLRESHAAYEDVPDGAVTEGGGVVLDFQGFMDGQPFEGGGAQGLLLDAKKDWLIPGFMEKIFGMKAGEEKEFQVDIPLNVNVPAAGKEATFKVRVQAVKKKNLPELTDDFAKLCGDFKTLDELKQEIRKNIQSYLDAQERTEGFHKAMERLSETIEFPVPEVFLEDRMKQFERDALHELEHANKQFPDFLKEKYPEVFAIEGVSDEEKFKRAVGKFREDLQPGAVKMAKVDLLLDEVWQREKLRITQDEVNQEVHRMAARYHMPPEAVAKALEDDHAFQFFVAGLLRAKASLIIRDSLKISHPKEENKT